MNEGNVAALTGSPKPKLRYCLYARKSSESEEKQALSIEQQVQEMRELAVRDSLDVVGIKSESHSAKDANKRPVYNEMLAEVRAGQYNAILTWAPDRLSRNAGDLGALVDLMDEKRLLEVRTYNQIFSDSPNEKFLLMILGSQAKLENDNRGVNVSRGLRSRVEVGLWPGVAPLGYLNLYRTDLACHVVPDPDRAPLIRQAFEKVGDEGWPVRKVWKWLNEDMGFRTRGDKPLTMSGLYMVLKNPFYGGRFRYPKRSGRWYTGVHEPIVSAELCGAVNAQLTRERNVRERHREFAFTKLISCGLCGSGMSAMEKFKPLKSGGRSRYVYYGCTRGRDRFCRAPYIREEDLLAELLRIVDGLDVDELGMGDEISREIGRFNAFEQILYGNGARNEKLAPHQLDARTYVKYVLREGGVEEKRRTGSHLRSRLVLKDDFDVVHRS